MTIKCSWCYKTMGVKYPYDNHAVSHSICEECEQRLLEDIHELSPDVSQEE